MSYNFIIKDDKQRKLLESYISHKHLKGFPCPFCHCQEVVFEKADTDNYTDVGIRVLCKYCRQVENYLHLKIEKYQIIGAKNTRTCLYLSDGIILDMDSTKDKWIIIDDSRPKYGRRTNSRLEVEPFFINYMKINELVEKIETLMVFA